MTIYIDSLLLFIFCSAISIPIAVIIHELGHLVVLRLIYKDSNSGIAFGNVKNKLIFNTKLFGIPAKRFAFFQPFNIKGSIAFVFPWDQVYNDRLKYRTFLFAIGGFMSEFACSILLYFILIHCFFNSVINLYSFRYVVFLLLFVLFFKLFLSPIVNLLFGIFLFKKTSVSGEAGDLLKIDYGYSDGRLAYLSNRMLFVLLIVIMGTFSYIGTMNLFDILNHIKYEI